MWRRLFDNLDKGIFIGEGKYDIPIIQPVTDYPTQDFIPINYARTAKDPASKTVHCFVDDYQFMRLWNRPDDNIPILSKFNAVCSPDFSTYTDMPMVMQIYNHYRKHWTAAYWQMHGMKVYPTISWSDESSYNWCFDGEPVGGIVAVSSMGCMKNPESKKLFLRGYEEMMKRLDPTYVIFYGKVPEECDWNVIRVEPYYEEIHKRQQEKKQDKTLAQAGGCAV